MRIAIILGLVLLGLVNGAATAAVDCTQRFPVGSSFVPYCSNGKYGPAVFVIHGTNRNADDYLGYLDDLDTLVIAPYFQDSGPGLYWTSGGWKRGDLSKDSERVSSYEVLDRMVEMYHGVAVIGHSAGGQFVTRYAAGTRLQGLAFIVANPSSYMYLDASRPAGSSSACPDFNEYKYGLEDPNSYMSAGVASDYPDRNVIYMLGSMDTKVDKYLDTSCEANRQGRNRYVRGMNFFEHLAAHYGRPVHRRVVVQGVGHSPSRMLNAARPYLAAALTGQGTQPAVTVAASSPARASDPEPAAPVAQETKPEVETRPDPAPAVERETSAPVAQESESAATESTRTPAAADTRDERVPRWWLSLSRLFGRD